MLLVHWCLFSCAFLQLCSARIIDCTVTPYSPDSNQTIYRVSDVSHVSDDQAPKCVYSWSNKQVLANHKQSDPKLVVRNSVNDLITSECFDSVNFTRHCGLEAEGYTAYCRTNCALNALSRSEKHKANHTLNALSKSEKHEANRTLNVPSRSEKHEANHTLNALSKSEKHEEIAAIAAIVVILVLLVVCAVVLYKCKGRISSSKPVRCIDESVKMQNAADPEAGESVESRLSSDQDV